MLKNLFKYVLVILAVTASIGLLWADTIAGEDSVRGANVISVNDSKQTHVQYIDTISQHKKGDSVVAKPEPKKRKSAETQLKTNQQRVENKKTIDSSLKLSLKKDTTDLQAQDSVQVAANPDSVNLATPNISEDQIHEYVDKEVPEVLSEWVFPLIITLFAFGFPFIFSVITRIEDKYNSDDISSSITNLCEYKNYKCSLYVSLSMAFAFCIMLIFRNVSADVHYALIIVAGLSSIWLVFTTFRLIYKLFQYNDPTKLFNLHREQGGSLESPKKEILSLYRYALKNDMKDLMESIESYLMQQVNDFRIHNAGKDSKISYPSNLLGDLYSSYDIAIKTNNKLLQEKIANLLCMILFESQPSVNNLSILSDEMIPSLWKFVKQSIIEKANRPFETLWNHLVLYYKNIDRLSELGTYVKEKEDLLDFYYIIGACCYFYNEYYCLELVIASDMDSDGFEDISYNHVEDILYRYYRTTNDYKFVKVKFGDVYKMYPIIDTKVRKELLISPIAQYTSFLIHRLYNKSPYYLQFNPIVLLTRLFGELPGRFKSQNTLFEALGVQKKIESSAELDVNIKKTMTEDDIKKINQNIAANTISKEYERLRTISRSPFWENEFLQRFSTEIKVMNFVLRKIFGERKSMINNNFRLSSTSADKNKYSEDAGIRQNGTKIPEIEGMPYVEIMGKDVPVICPKENFVYSTYVQASDDVYATAKKLAKSLTKLLINKHAEAFLKMKNGNAKWISETTELTDLFKDIKERDTILFYISAKNEKAEKDMPFSDDKVFTHNRGKVYLNGVQIHIINGVYLESSMYSSLKQSFIAISRKDLIAVLNNNIWDYESYNIAYDDFEISDQPMLRICANINLKLYYKENAYKLIRYKK